MGILNMLKGQLIDVIEWKDDSNDTMVHRYENNGKEIMMGAQLTVRESQVAIMVNEGKLADVFQPGRYELSTQNMPIMTALKSWKYGFNSPFRLRAFGIYSFRVADPVAFLKEVFGTTAYMTVEGVTGQIKRTLISGLSDAIAQSKIPALDLAANYDELSQFALSTLAPRVASLGLKLESFVIENISLPDEVEKAIDRRTSMGVVGDLNQYTQFQAAEAMRDAANNPNGMGGIGAGMGAAAMMAQAMQNAAQAPAAPQYQAPAQQPQEEVRQAAPAGETKFCSECGQRIPRAAKFCPECGAKQA